jgi:hypothetical protein
MKTSKIHQPTVSEPKSGHVKILITDESGMDIVNIKLK